MTLRKRKLHSIDQRQYRFNVMYQLQQVESNRALLYSENEKRVLKTILRRFKGVNRNKLRPIMDNILSQTLQSASPKPTVMINEVSNTKAIEKATALTSKATVLSNETITRTPETPNTNSTTDVAQDGVTSTNDRLNIGDLQNETFESIIERQLHDPKMSKVSVKIKRRRIIPKPKAATPYITIIENEHSTTIEKSAQQTLQIKRRKTNKRSYK
ncbi:hypothetical protein MBANPS3_007225 [Mucor bainieri]